MWDLLANEQDDEYVYQCEKLLEHKVDFSVIFSQYKLI